MFPRNARPCSIYKLHFPLECDGDLTRFLQDRASVEEWRYRPSALKEREKACKRQGKRQKMGMRQKKLTLSSLPGSISNLFPLQLAVWEGNGSSQSPWSAAPCPSERHSYPGFCVPVYQTLPVFTALQQRQHYVFLRRLCA